MSPTSFHIVDVFAQQQYAGNQLAVVEATQSLSDEARQQIAREFDFSETTFVESYDPADGTATVRIFTPEEEIPFAGHPTLGTAHVIRDVIADDTPDSVTLDLPVGDVPVRVEDTGGQQTLWMTQQPPEFREAFDHETVADVLSLDAAALDHEWPVRAVSTGLPTTIVPLESREALERISVDRAAYDAFVADHEARNILAFCPDPRDGENDLAVRVFAPFYGVPEDPATGSSNGCLAAYLARSEYFGDDAVDVRVEQGYEMGRPSLLHLRADAAGEAVTVQVGGRTVPVGRGELH